MKPGDIPSDDARLSALLRSWQVETTVPPQFAQAVWRRIGAGQRVDRPANPGTPGWLASLAGLLSQPRFALACLAAFLLAGASTGAWHGRGGSAALSDNLRGLYVQSIDPFAPGPR